MWVRSGTAGSSWAQVHQDVLDAPSPLCVTTLDLNIDSSRFGLFYVQHLQNRIWRLISNKGNFLLTRCYLRCSLKMRIPEPNPRFTEPDSRSWGLGICSFLPPPALGKSYYPRSYFPNFLDDKDHMIFLLKIQILVLHHRTTESRSPEGWGMGTRENGTQRHRKLKILRPRLTAGSHQRKETEPHP